MTVTGEGGQPRCDWCGDRIDQGELVTDLYAVAPDDGGLRDASTGPSVDPRVHATVCPDCYARALDEPGFEPVAVRRVGDQRAVLLPEPAQVGPVDCRYAVTEEAEQSIPLFPE
jgi:hypothetical protein